MSQLIADIKTAMKEAMRAKDKERLSTIRLMMAEFKRIEVDERIELDDARVLTVLDKMCKQRRDSIKQYEDADRPELAAKEANEITVIQEFLPSQLSSEDIANIIEKAIADTSASSIADMGKLMGVIKPQIQGRADMGEVSKLIKSKLS